MSRPFRPIPCAPHRRADLERAQAGIERIRRARAQKPDTFPCEGCGTLTDLAPVLVLWNACDGPETAHLTLCADCRTQGEREMEEARTP